MPDPPHGIAASLLLKVFSSSADLWPQVLVNGRVQGSLDRNNPRNLTLLPPSNAATDGHQLDIIVHALGRVNFGCIWDFKGLVNPDIKLNGACSYSSHKIQTHARQDLQVEPAEEILQKSFPRGQLETGDQPLKARIVAQELQIWIGSQLVDIIIASFQTTCGNVCSFRRKFAPFFSGKRGIDLGCLGEYLPRPPGRFGRPLNGNSSRRCCRAPIASHPR